MSDHQDSPRIEPGVLKPQHKKGWLLVVIGAVDKAVADQPEMKLGRAAGSDADLSGSNAHSHCPQQILKMAALGSP